MQKYILNQFFKSWRDDSVGRTHAVLAADVSLGVSTHIGQMTPTFNSPSRGDVMLPSGFQRRLRTQEICLFWKLEYRVIDFVTTSSYAYNIFKFFLSHPFPTAQPFYLLDPFSPPVVHISPRTFAPLLLCHMHPVTLSFPPSSSIYFIFVILDIELQVCTPPRAFINLSFHFSFFLNFF